MELNMNLMVMRRMKMKRMNKQVGGSHYENLQFEPVQFFVYMNTNWFQGEIVKYCSRFLNKNGKEDLLKAQQVCQLATQLGLNQANYFMIMILRTLSNNIVINLSIQIEWNSFVKQFSRIITQ